MAAVTIIAIGAATATATAQPRYREDRREWNRGHDRDRGYPGWGDGYYRAPPVVYGSPYRYRYVNPPPVIYNPGIGIYLPGLTLGIH